MSTPKKKGTGKSAYAALSSSTISTPQTIVSTPTVKASPSNAAPYSSMPDTISSTPGCPTAYICGQQNIELKQRIDKLEERIAQIEETAAEKRSFLRKTESLLLVFKIVLIAIPVVLFIALAIVQYFVYNDSKLLNIVTGIIGVATVCECILLPILWKSIDSRLQKVEEQLKD